MRSRRLGFPAWHPGDHVRVWVDGPVNVLAPEADCADNDAVPDGVGRWHPSRMLGRGGDRVGVQVVLASRAGVPDRERPDDRRHRPPGRLSHVDLEPLARISSTVARLQRQPQAKRRHGRWSRSCQRASRDDCARTCSMNSNSPCGRRTRAISSNARCGSSTVHSTSVATIVSTEPSASGSRSADASTMCATRPLRSHPAHQASTHRRVGLDQDQRLELVRVVAQVQARAGAELDHAPARRREQPPPMATQSRQLAEREERVIDEGEHTRPRARRDADVRYADIQPRP